MTHEGLKEFLPGGARSTLHDRAQRSDVGGGHRGERHKFVEWLLVVHRNPSFRNRNLCRGGAIGFPASSRNFCTPCSIERTQSGERHSTNRTLSMELNGELPGSTGIN